MASRRTKSIGTKVTPEEYERIRALAGDQPTSEWVRAALLNAAAAGTEGDSVVLAELVRVWRPAGRGCRLGALPRVPADHFPLPSSASLPKIEADSGLIRAVEGGRG